MPGAAKIAIGLGVGACFYAWLLLAGRGRPAVPALDLDAAPRPPSTAGVDLAALG
jgi:hypothetical protein